MSAKHDKETDKQDTKQAKQSDAPAPPADMAKAKPDRHQHKPSSTAPAKKVTTPVSPPTGGTTTADSRAIGQQASPPSRGGFWVIMVLGLIILSAGAAATYWLWLEQQKTAIQLEDAAAQVKQAAVQQQALQGSVSAVREQTSQLAGQLQQQLTIMDEMRIRFSQANEPVWLLDEAEYLVRIANHRLQLENDIASAIVALQLADQRLLQLAHPRTLPVRQLLSHEIVRLKAVAVPDIVGMAMTLTSLQQQLEQLPLSGALPVVSQEQQQIGNEPAAKGWRQFLSDVWQNLKQLVSIRRIDEQSVAIIAPEQRYFLRQNLALKLEGARYAVLRHDDAMFQQSLITVQQWLRRYFDAQDAAVMAFSQSLQQLGEVRLAPDIPPVSDALTELQRMQKQGLAAPPKTAPASTTTSGKANTKPETMRGEDSTPAATEKSQATATEAP